MNRPIQSRHPLGLFLHQYSACQDVRTKRRAGMLQSEACPRVRLASGPRQTYVRPARLAYVRPRPPGPAPRALLGLVVYAVGTVPRRKVFTASLSFAPPLSFSRNRQGAGSAICWNLVWRGVSCWNLVWRGPVCWKCDWRGRFCRNPVSRGSPNGKPADSPSPNGKPTGPRSPIEIPAGAPSPNAKATEAWWPVRERQPASVRSSCVDASGFSFITLCAIV